MTDWSEKKKLSSAVSTLKGTIIYLFGGIGALLQQLDALAGS